MSNLQQLSQQITSLPPEERGQLSDGYHSFNDLYRHRNSLWILVLCLLEALPVERPFEIWRSKKDSAGNGDGNWFLLGVGIDQGDQLTYHLPIDLWDRCNFADTLEVAPNWDGHTSDDVENRLIKLTENLQKILLQ